MSKPLPSSAPANRTRPRSPRKKAPRKVSTRPNKRAATKLHQRATLSNDRRAEISRSPLRKKDSSADRVNRSKAIQRAGNPGSRDENRSSKMKRFSPAKTSKSNSRTSFLKKKPESKQPSHTRLSRIGTSPLPPVVSLSARDLGGTSPTSHIRLLDCWSPTRQVHTRSPAYLPRQSTAAYSRAQSRAFSRSSDVTQRSGSCETRTPRNSPKKKSVLDLGSGDLNASGLEKLEQFASDTEQTYCSPTRPRPPSSLHLPFSVMSPRAPQNTPRCGSGSGFYPMRSVELSSTSDFLEHELEARFSRRRRHDVPHHESSGRFETRRSPRHDVPQHAHESIGRVETRLSPRRRDVPPSPRTRESLTRNRRAFTSISPAYHVREDGMSPSRTGSASPRRSPHSQGDTRLSLSPSGGAARPTALFSERLLTDEEKRFTWSREPNVLRAWSLVSFVLLLLSFAKRRGCVCVCLFSTFFWRIYYQVKYCSQSRMLYLCLAKIAVKFLSWLLCSEETFTWNTPGVRFESWS